MKKTLLALCAFALFATLDASAQLRKIPAVVTEAMKEKFPDAQQISWSDNVTNFQANFELENHEQSAYFSKKGTWKKTEKSLHEEEVPEAVKEGLSKSKYTGWDLVAYKEIWEAGGKHQYRLLVKKNDLQKKYLFFNEDGVLVRDAITL